MFRALDISTSGLIAQRTRLNTIAGNIANAFTTRDEFGRVNPYRPRYVVFRPGTADNPTAPGVHVAGIEIDQAPPKLVFDPGHPDADRSGYVAMPNVDLAMEYVNAIEASRAYEANVAAMDATKAMLRASVRLLA